MDESAVVRGAKLEDARAIAEVSVASGRWSYRGVLPDAVLDELMMDLDRMTSRFEEWLAVPHLRSPHGP